MVSKPRSPPTAAILIIGNEILSGRTRDVNVSHFAARLGARGIAVREARIVPDDEARIVAAVNQLRAAYDLLFTTGGIGPTHDDITADCIAKAFGVTIGEDPSAVAILEAYYGDAKEFTPARRRMTRIPEGAELIDNPVSRAPGFRLGNVFVMAGVPRINQAMLEAVYDTLPSGTPRLEVAIWGAVVEGRIGDTLRAIAGRFPAVEIGSYPIYTQGRFGTTFVLRSENEAALAASRDEVFAMIRDQGAEPHIGEPENKIAAGEPGR